MSESEMRARPRSHRAIAWGVIAVVVVAVIVVWGVASGWGGSPNTASSPTPTASTAQPTEPAPSQTDPVPPSSTPSLSPEPEEPEASPEPRETLPPADIDDTVEPTEGFLMRLVSIQSFQAEAAVPGETSGPAILIEVRGRNKSGEVVDTSALIVNVYYGEDRAPANILVHPREDFPLQIAAGGVETGKYAFSVPKGERQHVIVEVDLGEALPVVLFEGAV